MGRMRRTDSRFEFRADASDMEWFKAYCEHNGTSAGEEIRKWIQSLKRKAERAKRNTQEANR